MSSPNAARTPTHDVTLTERETGDTRHVAVRREDFSRVLAHLREEFSGDAERRAERAAAERRAELQRRARLLRHLARQVRGLGGDVSTAREAEAIAERIDAEAVEEGRL